MKIGSATMDPPLFPHVGRPAAVSGHAIVIVLAWFGPVRLQARPVHSSGKEAGGVGKSLRRNRVPTISQRHTICRADMLTGFARRFETARPSGFRYFLRGSAPAMAPALRGTTGLRGTVAGGSFP